MTYPDAMKLLKEKVAELGQAEVARRLKVSAATVSLVLAGTYNNGNMENILRGVVEVFGGLSVSCPVLGEIPLSRCAEERKKPFAAVNHQAVALWRACQNCERRS